MRYELTAKRPTTVRDLLRREYGVSARLLSLLKRTPGGMTVKTEPVTARRQLAAGETLTLRLPEDRLTDAGEARDLRVLYEDEEFLVLDKPAGMPMYPTARHETGSLSQAVRGYYHRRGEGTAFRPLYRLDKDTTGLLIAAKNSYVAAAAAVQKVYFALCAGVIDTAGVVDAPIGLAPGHAVQRQAGLGQPARTHYAPLAAGCGRSFVRCALETGRTHQIRVHMASIGHPLLGDDFYGGPLDLLPRQALHCGQAEVRLPTRAQPLRLWAPLPADMRALLPPNAGETEAPPYVLSE